jgi:hypothetical protein
VDKNSNIEWESRKNSNKIVHLIKHIKPLKTILILNQPKEELNTCLSNGFKMKSIRRKKSIRNPKLFN